MPQNANAQRLIDIANEIASIRARLNRSAEYIGTSIDLQADLLTKAAESIGVAFDALWDTAKFIGRTPNEKEDEWAKALSTNYRPAPPPAT